jgi:L-ascorbate metabolism protein UlaG (beta-lactamase superfamily)
MVITYHGGAFFKVSFGDMTLAFNPISKDSKLKGTRFGADIALISHNHPDFSGADQVAHGERQPFVISGPGEYEVRGVFIQGLPSETRYGEGGINTLYTVELENMQLCFLGALSARKLSAEVKGALPDIDILFIPVGGAGVLSPTEAHELIVELEPKLVIPMLYDEGVGEKNALKHFLGEAEQGVKPVEKLTLKRKDLEGKEGEIVVLSY